MPQSINDVLKHENSIEKGVTICKIGAKLKKQEIGIGSTIMKDSDYISQALHELNYVLKKYKKRQTKGNRELLKTHLVKFKADPGYAPHKRKLFYQYAAASSCFDEFEDQKK